MLCNKVDRPQNGHYCRYTGDSAAGTYIETTSGGITDYISLSAVAIMAKTLGLKTPSSADREIKQLEAQLADAQNALSELRRRHQLEVLSKEELVERLLSVQAER